MYFTFIVLGLFVILTILFVFLGLSKDEEFFYGSAFFTGVISFFVFIFLVFSSTFNISTGNAGLETNFSGSYTGKVITETGTHWFEKAPSHGVDKIDVRNNKLPVEVNVMKDKTYNVNANVEVVYDLNPNKLVDLKSNYSDYKNTVIGATVKQVLTSNNTLANSQSLSETDQKQITDRLHKFGIEVTNIYMNSYKLTNSSNYGLNVNGNNDNNNK